jgi:FMN-dependent oxidoreductase (nitrilotriacetate monooxygenase family)
MFHMAWFVGRGYSPYGWNQPWSGEVGTNWMRPELNTHLARALERACFDYMMIEDGSFVPDAFRGSPDYYLRTAYSVPKNDPMPLVPLLGQATRRLGIVATVTTSFYPPFLAARLGATLDHLTEGRFGFNLVTAHNDRSAQNYGLDKHYEHDLRYEMADEWIDVVSKLWRSWEPDAIVADRDGGTFTDPAKVHPIHHEGRFFRSRGPLNTAPGPQGRPVICQAGGSPAGIGFAAKHADTIISRVSGIAAAKAYRETLSVHMQAAGRDPSECKLLFSFSAVLGDTQSAAAETKQRLDRVAAADIDLRLASMSFASGIDFSKFDLDAPVPEVKTNAARSSTAMMTGPAGQKTLREVASAPHGVGLDFVGTPDTVACRMIETMQEIGGDGFLVNEMPTRRKISEITDGLMPVLKRKGAVRKHYAHPTFRENLLAF